MLLINVLLGLFPAIALAWSVAADEKKSDEEKVVNSAGDHKQQRRIFLMVSGLWFLTLAMWNWMRSESVVWILFWIVVGVSSLVVCRVMSVRARAS